MTINGTLLVQAFNFLIAYLMLRELLFKPLVVLIQQEDNNEQRLYDALEEQQQKQRVLQQKYHQQWTSYQDYFSKHMPHIEQIKHRAFPEIPPLVKSSTAELNRIMYDLTERIVHEVDYVRR
jgi:F0F1-type ATP synthase membrane subunit b/b'